MPESTAEVLKVLIVEDEPSLADVLTRMLAFDGWSAKSSSTGTEALVLAAEFRPHAVVLDIGLPDIDGFEVLRRLRASDPAICVLFLTARDAVEDRVAGIRAGADDYVTKPFSTEEVAARLRGLVRRAGLTQRVAGDALTFGDLSMHEDTREVWRGDDPIDLTATEFELLRFLLRNPRRVLSKSQILAQVWDYDFGGSAHVVELYISYLRKKIDSGRPAMIHTVRGVGYVLRAS